MLKVKEKMSYNHRIFLLDELPKNSICAEIGVFEGTFSYKIMEVCKPKKIYLIDSWFQPNYYINKKYFTCEYVEIQNKFENVKIEDKYFDWVYLDADHSFLSTFEQLKKCYRKVKIGGIICGDDYNENNWGGLVKAVDLFLKIYKDRVKLEYIKNWQYKIWKKK